MPVSVRSRAGTSRQPASTMKATPTTATAAPTGVKSNMPKLPSPDPARKPDTIRLGGVPIRVVMPPRIEPKATGIRMRPGGMPSRFATWMATGMSSARAPTLFMKPDITAARIVSAPIMTVGPPDRGSRVLVSTSTAPDVCRP